MKTVTIARYPIIEDIKRRMLDDGAMNALMSGSGPTVFGIYEDEEKAQRTMKELRYKKLAKQAFVVLPFNTDFNR